jgi:two-component system chemotaxis response regulator CheB
VALVQIAAVVPDVVTLDIDMPEMNGLETLRRIRARWPDLPVVMFTGLAEPGFRELEALGIGACDCINKLPHEGNMLNAIEWTRTRLAPRLVTVVSDRRAEQIARKLAPAPGVTLAAPPVRGGSPEVLVIGASTGGPNALEDLLTRFPADFSLPILIVQHLPAGFTRLLAERLNARTQLHAVEARSGMEVSPGRVYLAPGSQHLVVQRTGTQLQLQTNQDPPENSCRPAADVLFRSAAQSCGSRVLGVVLTGMGQDGVLGAEAIVKAGGQVLVQDEASSVVWGMPGAVARAGFAAAVLPVPDLAVRLIQRTLGGRVAVAESRAREHGPWA